MLLNNKQSTSDIQMRCRFHCPLTSTTLDTPDICSTMSSLVKVDETSVPQRHGGSLKVLEEETLPF